MTKTLKILFILILSLIILFWVIDLTIGVNASISDKALIENRGEDKVRYEREVLTSQLKSLLYAIPAIIMMVLTLQSIRKRNELLFHKTFISCLTLLQVIPISGLVSNKSQAPAFFHTILIILFLLFLSGQLVSIFKIWKLKLNQN